MFAWCRPRPELPDDDRELAMMLGVTITRWRRKIRPALEGIWTVENGLWTQGRLTREFQKTEEKSSKNRANANTRWNKSDPPQSSDSNSLGDANAMPRARASKPEPKPEERKKDTPSNEGESSAKPLTRSSILPMIDIWNAVCGDVLSKVRLLTDARQKTMALRLADMPGGLEEWRAICQRVRGSPFLTGQNDRGFTAGLDWVLKPANFCKILEGNYDDRASSRRNGNGFFDGVQARADARATESLGQSDGMAGPPVQPR
jgi:uncharacterized protein YdaU (DUF1376 family)